MDASTQKPGAAEPSLDQQELPHRVLLPLADPHPVEFNHYLHQLCAELARVFVEPGGPVLTCTTAVALVPVEVAVRLGLVAEELVRNAFGHAFPGGRTGRIDVLFAADPDAWRLTVADSGVGMPRRDRCSGAGLAIARRLVGELGGRLEFPGAAGGTRCVAVAARSPPFRPCCSINAAGDVGPGDPTWREL